MVSPKIRLSINIDHVATLREARQGFYPDPLEIAKAVLSAGADGITVHLREDRRHIKERDVLRLRKLIRAPHELNLEMALSSDIMSFALRLKPDQVTLVPEKRRELTTEGGLNLFQSERKVRSFVKKLRTLKKNIRLSFFIEPHVPAVHKARELGADAVEIHTGRYVLLGRERKKKELHRIQNVVREVLSQGLEVHVGHGLDPLHIPQLVHIHGIKEMSIGFYIVSRSLLVGMSQAVREIRTLLSPS